MAGALDFVSGVGQGAWGAAKGIVTGVADLAKGGYALATDPKAREEAWNTTKAVAGAASDYAGAVADDPKKLYRDAKDGAAAAYTSFEEFRQTATAEDWGKAVGGGAVEIGTALVPVGALAKVGKIGKAAKAADKLDDAADAARAATRAKRAREVADKFPCAKPSAKRPCPTTLARAEKISRLKKDRLLRENLPDEFFDKDGNIIWPKNDKGFAEQPVSDTLKKDYTFDRYTNFDPADDKGHFFSPVDTPFAERSLPYDPEKMPKRTFRVKKEFDVDRGRAEPHFGEKGLGTQYHSSKSIQELIDGCFIEEIGI